MKMSQMTILHMQKSHLHCEWRSYESVRSSVTFSQLSYLWQSNLTTGNAFLKSNYQVIYQLSSKLLFVFYFIFKSSRYECVMMLVLQPLKSKYIMPRASLTSSLIQVSDLGDTILIQFPKYEFSLHLGKHAATPRSNSCSEETTALPQLHLKRN